MTTTGNNHGKRATIRGVASAAGVSIATVSRVLNGRPDVAPETREIVLRAVREQGFSTNRNARALSGGRTGLIGVTVPLVEAAYFGVILAGASEALYEQDMRIVLCPTLHQHDREVNLLDRLMQGTTDKVVWPRNAQSLGLAMQREGEPVELKMYPDIGHSAILLAMSRPFRDKAPVLDDTTNFIQAQVAQRRRTAAVTP